MSFTANTRIANSAALHYGATVTSHNIMQQQKLAACVWEYVMASASDITLSSLVVCIMGRMKEFSVSNLTPKPDLLNVYFAYFSKYPTKYLKWKRENFLLFFSV